VGVFNGEMEGEERSALNAIDGLYDPAVRSAGRCVGVCVFVGDAGGAGDTGNGT